MTGDHAYSYWAVIIGGPFIMTFGLLRAALTPPILNAMLGATVS